MALQQKIEQRTSAAGIGYDIFPSRANGEYGFLLPHLKEKKVTDIVIIGGDGTVSQVIGGLRGQDLNFGIIPCGSGNGLAYAAGIPHNPDRALDLVLEGSSSCVDAFLVNEKFACNLCGLGFDAKVAQEFALQQKRGLLTYTRQVIKNFFTAKTFPFEVSIGDHCFHTDAYFISIANSNQFGNRFTIAPKASLTDGLLDVVIVTRQHKLSLLWQVLRQVRGGNKLVKASVSKDRKGVIYFQAPEIRISNSELAPLHIDGDPAVTGKDFTFRILENNFRLIRPVK